MLLGALVFLPLPLAAVLLRMRAPERGWRSAWVMASLGWGTGSVAVAEILSLGRALAFGPVLAVWLAATVLLALLVARAWRTGGGVFGWPKFSGKSEWLLAAILGGLLMVSLATALAAPPNTADALSYHLPRQLMWLQQGSVDHFLTANDRALMMPALAEMMQVQAMLLAGSDGWANVPQWIAYALGMMVASLLARELGAGRAGQWTAALVFATVPMAWHEASSAKNDLLVAVWLGILAWLALRIAGTKERSTREWAAAGVALGLALATKATAFLLVVPVALVLAVASLRNGRGVLLAGALALAIVGPHWARNQAWYGTPLGVHRAEDGGAQGNTTISWRGTVSNFLRNATLHTATPWTVVNEKMRAAVGRAHQWMGQEIDDRRTTLWTLAYTVRWGPRHETIAGAPAQALLGLAAFLLWAACGPWRGPPLRIALLLAGFALMYCLLLKWQLWGARLQLPGFLLAAGLSAWAVERLGNAGRWGVAVVCLAGWIPSLETLLRPLWTSPTIFAASRWENYFRFESAEQPLERPLEQQFQEDCLRVIEKTGVKTLQVFTRHGFPYPLMRRFTDGGSDRRFWGSLPESLTEAPDGVLFIDPQMWMLPLYFKAPNATESYRAVGMTWPYAVYLPEAQARALEKSLGLPMFIGWHREEGLGLEGYRARGDGVSPVQHLTAAVCKLEFRRAAGPMRAHVEVRNPARHPVHMEIRLDGKILGLVNLEPRGDWRSVDVALEPALETAELTLGVASENGGEPAENKSLQFAAIRILD